MTKFKGFEITCYLIAQVDQKVAQVQALQKEKAKTKVGVRKEISRYKAKMKNAFLTFLGEDAVELKEAPGANTVSSVTGTSSTKAQSSITALDTAPESSESSSGPSGEDVPYRSYASTSDVVAAEQKVVVAADQPLIVNLEPAAKQSSSSSDLRAEPVKNQN